MTCDSTIATPCHPATSTEAFDPCQDAGGCCVWSRSCQGRGQAQGSVWAQEKGASPRSGPSRPERAECSGPDSSTTTAAASLGVTAFRLLGAEGWGAWPLSSPQLAGAQGTLLLIGKAARPALAPGAQACSVTSISLPVPFLGAVAGRCGGEALGSEVDGPALSRAPRRTAGSSPSPAPAPVQPWVTGDSSLW